MKSWILSPSITSAIADLTQIREENSKKEQREGQMPKLIELKLEARLKTGARGTVTIIKGISTKREIDPQKMKLFPM